MVYLGLPINSMVIFHGYVSHNQMVYVPYLLLISLLWHGMWGTNHGIQMEWGIFFFDEDRVF